MRDQKSEAYRTSQQRKSGKQWSNTFKILKENYCQYRVSIASQTTNQR